MVFAIVWHKRALAAGALLAVTTLSVAGASAAAGHLFGVHVPDPGDVASDQPGGPLLHLRAFRPARPLPGSARGPPVVPERAGRIDRVDARGARGSRPGRLAAVAGH